MELPPIQLELEAPAEARPGARVAVAARIVAPAGWHVYWGENPGETGLATRATLSGAPAEGPSWTAPTRHVDPGGQVSFVYEPEGRAVWWVHIPARGPVQLDAELSWLMCREACVPGSGRVSATVEVNRRAAPAPGPDAHLPRPAPASLSEQGHLVVCLPAPTPPTAFPNVAFEAAVAGGSWTVFPGGGRWVSPVPPEAPGDAALVLVSPDDVRGWRVDLATARSHPTCP